MRLSKRSRSGGLWKRVKKIDSCLPACACRTQTGAEGRQEGRQATLPRSLCLPACANGRQVPTADRSGSAGASPSHLNGYIETKVIGVTVSNMKYAGGGMVFAPNAILDDGLFDICIVREIGKFSFVLTFPQMYKDTGAKHPALSRHRSSAVRIFTKQTVDKMFDGNINGKTPLEAKVLPKAIDVIVP